MRSTLLLLLLALALLGPANVRALSPFRSPSPDGKFEAVYADINDTIHVGFQIIDRATGNTVAALDDDRVSNRNMGSLWSPSGKRLVALNYWTRWTEVIIFRQVGGRFEQAKGLEIGSADVYLDRWIAPNKVRVKGDGYSRILVITNHTAEFAR